MKNDMKFRGVLRTVFNFLTFFLIVSFVVTCSTMLFVSILSETLDIELTGDNIGLAAKITFLNVIFISLLITVIDYIRRSLILDRPIADIKELTERIAKGELNARIRKRSTIFAGDEFSEIIDSINEMSSELSRLEAMRQDFSLSVSHELKTPLAVINNYATLLSSPEISDCERVEYATAIASTTTRLAELVTNILKLSKLENQQIRPTYKRYSLDEQLREIVILHEAFIGDKSINLDIDIDDDIFINSDAELLSIVWNNIISNAIKFTDDGGNISVKAKIEDGSAFVVISDNGCGIPREVGERIFDKFYQADPSRRTRGNGLGLALVKKVIDLVKGEISVESKEGVGTSFTVRLWCVE